MNTNLLLSAFLAYTGAVPLLMLLVMIFKIKPKNKVLLITVFNVIPMFVSFNHSLELTEITSFEYAFAIAISVGVVSFFLGTIDEFANRVASVGLQISAALNFVGAILCFLINHDGDFKYLTLIFAFGMTAVFSACSAWYLSKIKHSIKAHEL
jgi:hypothetical protein